jgi:hypothetical protein
MHTQRLHIGLNAHLLTAQAGYRSAGINGYIYNLIGALPEADPSLTYTVFVGRQGHPPSHPCLTARRTPWRTENPVRRILWEQVAQPVALWRTRPDLVHALAFVAPVVSRTPMVATVYDLSTIRNCCQRRDAFICAS